MEQKVLAKFLILLQIFGLTWSQCTSPLGTPAGYPDDSSGVRAVSAPPIQVGLGVDYTCPGNKGWNGKTSWNVKCKPDLTYDYSEIPVWPECQCMDTNLAATQCENVIFTSRYSDNTGKKCNEN